MIMKKWIIISLISLVSLVSMISLINTESYTILIDYNVYMKGLKEFENNALYSTSAFIYLPSFFILTPFLLNIVFYLTFLIFCLFLSLLLLIKLKENIIVILLVFFYIIERIICANIDPFIFLFILVAIRYKDNDYIPPILISFLLFKPTVIFIVPYFLYISKNKFKFIFLFVSCFSLFNIHFFFNVETISMFLESGFTNYQDIRTYTRGFWLYYVYYHFFASRNRELKKAKIEGKIRSIYDMELNVLKA